MATLAVSWFDIELLLFVTAGVSSARPWSSMATIQFVQSNSHTVLIALATAWPVTPTTAATWKAHLVATILCRCHPPFKSEGKEGRWKGKEGKREAHPERMLDKDGSRDILSTFISSGGGELCWILACYWQSHTLWAQTESMSQSNLAHLISIFLTEKVGHMGQDANCLFYMVINIPQTVLYGRCVSTVTKFISQIYICISS